MAKDDLNWVLQRFDELSSRVQRLSRQAEQVLAQARAVVKGLETKVAEQAGIVEKVRLSQAAYEDVIEMLIGKPKQGSIIDLTDIPPSAPPKKGGAK